MKFIDVLREQIEKLDKERVGLLAEADALVEDRDAFGPEQETRGAVIVERLTEIDAEIRPLQARAQSLSEAEERAALASLAPVSKPSAPAALDVIEDRAATPSQLADALTRSLEDRVEADNMAHVRRLVVRHAGDHDWARNLIVRSSEAYKNAWAKMAMGRPEFLEADERAALAVGTNTQGGYLVPTHLDPSIILTNSGTSNAIRAISRVVTLTQGNTWNGVTSAGVTASWDGELVEVSDDSPSVAQAQVPTHQAQALVQASIAAIEDIDALASDILMMFADAKDRLEGAAHATGSGSGQPTGIFTALDANTNVELTSATAATLALADLQSVYRNVPVRFRGMSTWLMNPLYLGQIQALGTAMSASYSTDITQGYASQLLGRGVVESDDAPTTQTTTVRDNEIILGDFSNYVIVDKPGSMSVEFIPHMFNTANNLPDGRRAWFAYWRTGADSVNDVAFRLLQDKTSA